MSRSARNFSIGRIVRATTANPPPATAATISNPGLPSNILVALMCTLTTDANAADRIIHLLHVHAAAPRTIGLATISLPASQSATALASCFGAPTPSTNNLTIPIQLAYPIDFQAADTLTISVVNIQAADQLAFITHWWQIFY